MKKQIILFLLIVISFTAHSQAFQASYTYDGNGNRISAAIIWLTSSLKSDVLADSLATDTLQGASVAKNTAKTIKGFGSPSIDSLAGTKITVYPNPTHGILLVKREGGTAQSLLVAIYDIQGNKIPAGIVQTDSQPQLITVSLQDQPSGSYVMVVQVGTVNKTYTIIKN